MFNYLICLVGFPASGKSTFAQKFKEIMEQKSDNCSVTIIDPDIIRESITSGKFNHEKEKSVRKKNLKAIKKALISGDIVVSDDLNYYSSMRHDLMEIAETLKRGFFIIHIATPLETCLKWNEKRGKKVPNAVIQDVSNKFDEFNRYKWDLPLYTIDLSRVPNLSEKMVDIINMICNSVDKSNGSSSKDFEVQDHSNPYNERLEKITRKFVGDLLKNPEFRKIKEKVLKLRRQFVIENLNQSFSKTEITRALKTYLESRLNIRIS